MIFSNFLSASRQDKLRQIAQLVDPGKLEAGL
jgi:hypothetical protein